MRSDGTDRPSRDRLTLGGALALGLHCNRDRIRFEDGVEVLGTPPGWEWAAFGVHTTLRVSCELLDLRWATQVYDFGLVLAALPILAVALGLRWPAWVMLPLIVLTIGGNTFRAMAGESSGSAMGVLVLLDVVLPVGVCGLVAWHVIGACRSCRPARCWLRLMLLLNVGLYFGLNFAFFQFPWPWLPWPTKRGLLRQVGLQGPEWGWPLSTAWLQKQGLRRSFKSSNETSPPQLRFGSGFLAGAGLDGRGSGHQ